MPRGTQHRADRAVGGYYFAYKRVEPNIRTLRRTWHPVVLKASVKRVRLSDVLLPAFGSVELETSDIFVNGLSSLFKI
jgi:hypothetical protein